MSDILKEKGFSPLENGWYLMPNTSGHFNKSFGRLLGGVKIEDEKYWVYVGVLLYCECGCGASTFKIFEWLQDNVPVERYTNEELEEA